MSQKNIWGEIVVNKSNILMYKIYHKTTYRYKGDKTLELYSRGYTSLIKDNSFDLITKEKIALFSKWRLAAILN